MKFLGPDFIIAAVLCATVFAGCNNNSMAQTSAATPNTTFDIPHTHQKIIESFAKAESALEKGDGAALIAAAKTLESLGAKPVTGTEDVAKIWTLKARKTADFDEGSDVPYRGRVKGPAYRRQTVVAGGSDEMKEIYYAAEPVVMTLSPSQNGALNWEVIETDTKDDAVCSTKPIAKIQTCNFTPLWTGQYHIKITNTSDQDVTYIFVTN